MDVILKCRFLSLNRFVKGDQARNAPMWIIVERYYAYRGTPGNRSSGDEVGPVAQRIRARGYEPQCQGFESLLAHNRPKREGPFPLG
ncbi:hypothetical protein Gotri_021082, partial [Gossypium trilobum]|nr:hypothetical protein [Gossypium trilobum]